MLKHAHSMYTALHVGGEWLAKCTVATMRMLSGLWRAHLSRWGVPPARQELWRRPSCGASGGGLTMETAMIATMRKCPRKWDRVPGLEGHTEVQQLHAAGTTHQRPAAKLQAAASMAAQFRENAVGSTVHA